MISVMNGTKRMFDWLERNTGGGITDEWRWRFVLFWIILFSIIVAYALRTTHNQAVETKQIAVETQQIAEQNKKTITYLCLVVRTLDPVTQRARNTVGDPVLRGEFQALHLVLSDQSACGNVEG